ncbi:unnamed protein product [Chrysoparadoxa australica]
MALTATSTVQLNNGLAMPVIGLGTWRSSGGAVTGGVEHALKHGYVHIDTAFNYQNEEEVAAGLGASGVPRESVFLTEKLWCSFMDKDKVARGANLMLKKLGVDYVDQLLIHWPTPIQYAGDTDDDHFPKVCASVRASSACFEQGKAKSIGVSNFSVAELEKLLASSKVTPAVNQCESNPYFNNADLREWCKARQIHFVAYRQSESSLPFRLKDVPSCLRDEVIVNLAKKHGKSPAQVIIRWHLQNGVTVLPKSVTPSRIDENLNVFDFELPAEDMAAIDGLGARNFRTCNPRFKPNNELVFAGDTTVFD